MEGQIFILYHSEPEFAINPFVIVLRRFTAGMLKNGLFTNRVDGDQLSYIESFCDTTWKWSHFHDIYTHRSTM